MEVTFPYLTSNWPKTQIGDVMIIMIFLLPFTLYLFWISMHCFLLKRIIMYTISGILLERKCQSCWCDSG